MIFSDPSTQVEANTSSSLFDERDIVSAFQRYLQIQAMARALPLPKWCR